jgi:hypothetical protein
MVRVADDLKDAREQFLHSQDGSAHNRETALEDIEFARLSKQWPDEIQRLRREEGRPCLTINKLPAFIRQVVNDARQNSPSINVVPVDSGADIETAQVYDGLTRAIQRGSNANVAYDTALEHAVTGGFGFFRLCMDYAHPDSFDMELRVERVANPLSVYWDTSSTQFDASDWGYAFVAEDLTANEFKRQYPKAKAISWEMGRGDETLNDWIGENSVRVAEWWTRESKIRKIVLLSDGSVVPAEDLKKPFPVSDGRVVSMAEAIASRGLSVLKERDAEYFTVRRRLINGADILEETDWPGSMIPICPVWGEEIIYDGRRHFRSLVRDAIDPQRMFNYWRSASTELVALTPRAPFLVPEGAIPRAAAEARKWSEANTRSHPYLMYAGQTMPQRQVFTGIPAGALQEALSASDDMKAVMGIYDASLGARSNETSGRAIMARQREGDVSTFHFMDNLARAIQYAGRVMVECIPHVYSERQAVQILGADEAPKVVKLVREGNLAVQEGPDGEKVFNLGVGKYDVAVKTGPSFTTQREMSREVLIELVRARPEAGAVLGDLIVRTMDFPEAETASKRLKALLPPQVLAAEQEGGDGMPPEAQAMVSSMQQQMQQMQAALMQATQAAQDKQGDMAVKAEELKIKGREVDLKGQELAIKAAEMQMRQQAEVQDKAAEAESDAADDAAEQQFQQGMVAALAAIAQGQQSLAQAVMQGNQALAQGIAQVAAYTAAPKRIVHDANGRPIGSEIALN